MMVTGPIGKESTRPSPGRRDRLTDDATAPSPIEMAHFLEAEIRRTALRITRSDSASHDVTQEVFVRVLTRGGYDANKGTLEAWLHMVAHSTAVDWVRRETAQQRRLAQCGALHSATMPVVVDETVSARIQADQLRAAVAALPEVERAVVELAYFGGLSYRQVAQRLDLAEGTVKSRIRRALTRLAHLVEPDAIALG